MEISSLISSAIQAIKENDLETARRTLSRAVKTDPESDTAWTLLGYCLEDREKKIFCFQKALSINSKNETAQQFLRSLETDIDGHSPFPDFEPAPDIPVLEDKPSKEKTPKKSNTGNILVFTFCLMLGFFLIGLPLWINLNVSIVPPDYIYRPAQILTAITSGNLSNINLRPKLSVNNPTPLSTVENDPISMDFGEVPESRYERYLYTKPMKKQATVLFRNKKYSEAALLWDEILAITPDYAFGYLARAQCYYALGRYDQRMLQETREYYDRAYSDLNQAIKLGLELGKLYNTQAEVYLSRGNLEEYRINRDLWYEMGLEANLTSIDKGIRPQWGNRNLGFQLIYLGRCEEALDYFRELEAINNVESAGIYTGLANSYLCLKDYDQALDYIDLALGLYRSYEREQTKAIIQLNDGQLEEALEYFDQDIAASPNYGARRYLFRAAIYYELGNYDQALENISESYGKSWGTKGLQSYVLGRIAIDQGDLEEGLNHLLDAEATMLWTDTPRYYDWVVAEIERLGSEPLYPTPTPDAYPTPTPIEPLPDHLYITPTPPYDFAYLSTVNYSGMSIRLFEKGDAVDLKFHPDSPIKVDRVTALYLYLDTDHTHDEIDLQYECIPKNGSWGTASNPVNYTELYPGENQIRYPDECVPENGIIYISVMNFGEIDALVNDLRIKMEFINGDGEEEIVGYQ